MKRSEKQDEAVITDAHSGASDELGQRQKRYAITMAFRTACFVGLLFVPGAWKWVLLAGAVFLPYVAVLFANQADKGTVAAYAGPVVEVTPMPQLTTGEYETITVDLDDLEDPLDWRTGEPVPGAKQPHDRHDSTGRAA